MIERVYLFQGNYLVMPEASGDTEAAAGVDKSLAAAAFGELAYYAVPPAPGEDPSTPGFLLPAETVLPPGWRHLSVRQALAALGFSGGPGRTPVVFRIFRLYHILQWREESRFCGSCGAANGDSPDELARLCPRCGRLEYPRISPAVIVLIINDRGEALLAHNKKFRDNIYSLIAGFVEAGESLEDAAVREIREEVNLEIQDLRFTASQGWPFPNSLMAGFTARHAGGEIVCDGVEILDARWFSAESVRSGAVELPGPGSVSRFLIEKWLAGKLEKPWAVPKTGVLGSLT